MGDAILKDILTIFVFSIPSVLIAHRFKIPAIVGFLLTGVIIGPHSLGLIPNVEDIRVLAEAGVALLLFSIGLEFSLDRLKGWGVRMTAMGVSQIVLTALLCFLAGEFLGSSTMESLIFGFAGALSSTAIVLSVLSGKRWFDAPAGRIATGILILQDLAVIPMIVLLKFISDASGGHIFEDLTMAGAKMLALIAALFVIGKWILTPLLDHISRPLSRELFVVVVVGLAIGAAYVTEKMGLSFALGAFLAGLLVSSTKFRFQALSEISPFRYCFSGLFFVAVGMIVDVNFVAVNWPAVVLLMLIFMSSKLLATSASVIAFGYPLSVAVIAGLMISQVGEFSFLLTHFGFTAGVISQDAYQMIVSSAASTMVLAPLLVAIAPKVGEKLSFLTWRSKTARGREQAAPDEEARLQNHAIICGFGPLGMAIGKLLEDKKIEYVILELNPRTVDRHAKKGRRIYLGDGSSAALLHHSGIKDARLLAIAIPDFLNARAIIEQARLMNEGIFIVARSRYRDQCQDLYAAGADVVICEELEAGIEMGRYILMELGMADDDVDSMIGHIREFGSADFF
jgi:CPA2 family monovalent cation:H+ antiporter-2